MNPNEDKLSALLKQWRPIEPPASFETDVWRRLRLAQTAAPTPVSLVDLLRQLWQRPALAISAAAMVSVLIGVSAGLLTASRPVPSARSEMQFLSAGTLAGGYVQLAVERGR